MAGGMGRRSGWVLGHAHLRVTCTVLLAVEVDEGLDTGVLEEVVHCGDEVHKCVREDLSLVGRDGMEWRCRRKVWLGGGWVGGRWSYGRGWVGGGGRRGRVSHVRRGGGRGRGACLGVGRVGGGMGGGVGGGLGGGVGGDCLWLDR